MLGDIIPSCENNWSPVVAGEKGKAKMNGLQAFSPVGLKVLVVDDNPVCLAILEKMLKQCNYSVTTCNSAAAALSLVQKNCNAFDLVLCDVHMPGMDGFKLLEAISLEQDLPVVMMSSDEELEVVKKFVTNGACDYLFKPVCLQRLQTIWLHVYRKQRELRECMNDGDCTGIDNGRSSRFPSDRDSFRKRKGKEEAMDEPVGFVNGSKKKARLVWTRELHKLFVEAVTHLGMANAVPKQILEKMNVKGISRENVASHLQKYRKYITDQEMSVDLKDPVGGMNMLSHSHEPFQAGGIFGGSIEVQPPSGGAVSYTVPSIHAPFCHGYGGHTDLYPVPSQSFRAIEAGITSPLGDTRSDPMVFPSMDAACSSNFLNRMRQFPGNFQVPQTLPPPAFYLTEYDS